MVCIECAVKLEIIWLIEDWKENSDGTIGRYGIQHEIIPTTTMSVGYEMLRRRLTDWTFWVNATVYLSPAVGEGLTVSIDRRWCCMCAPSCHSRKIDQE